MYTKKEKELAKLFPFLKGKRVAIYQPCSGTYYCIGTWIEFTGSYIILNDVLIWNGHRETHKMVNSRHISKIIEHANVDGSAHIDAAGFSAQNGTTGKDGNEAPIGS